MSDEPITEGQATPRLSEEAIAEYRRLLSDPKLAEERPEWHAMLKQTVDAALALTRVRAGDTPATHDRRPWHCPAESGQSRRQAAPRLLGAATGPRAPALRADSCRQGSENVRGPAPSVGPPRANRGARQRARHARSVARVRPGNGRSR